jgi:two-component system response regulator AtoC
MDVSLLMDYFIIESSLKNNKCIVILSKKTREILYTHDWPGNVDELSTYMYRVSAEGHESCIFNNNNIQKILKSSRHENFLKSTGIDTLPEAHEIKALIPTVENLGLRSICDEFVARTEKRLMKKALESTNWNRKKAAKLLNISYKSMLNKIKVYDII